MLWPILQVGVLCVLAQSDSTGQSNVGSMPQLAEFGDNFQQCCGHSPVVAVYRGLVDGLAVLQSDITLAIRDAGAIFGGVNGQSWVTECSQHLLPDSCLSAAGTYEIGLVGDLPADLWMDTWHTKKQCAC